MRHILLAIAMLFVGSAQAGVVYNWETVDSAGYISPYTGLPPVFSGRIEIDDAAWLSGSVSHINTPVCPPWMCWGATDFSDPANPVLQFAFDGLARPRWAIGVLDLTTIPVPAPGTLALILPWAALGLGRRRLQ